MIYLKIGGYMEYEEQFLKIINPIITHEEYLKRKNYMHHENLSVYDHSMIVAYKSYKFAKKHNMDIESITIGAILHDFYYKPWQENKEKKKFFEMHGFVHAKEALENSKIYFPTHLNPKIEDIILKHMFPLNIALPKYKESWVVTCMDKISSLDVLKHPKEYPKYLGLSRKKRK